MGVRKDVSDLEADMEKRSLNLDDLLRPAKFKNMSVKDRDVLLTRRLINWEALQDFLKRCSYKDVKMVEALYLRAETLGKKDYLINRIIERLNKLSNEARQMARSRG